jgi:hypothetical protein
MIELQVDIRVHRYSIHPVRIGIKRHAYGVWNTRHNIFKLPVGLANKRVQVVGQDKRLSPGLSHKLCKSIHADSLSSKRMTN